MIKQYMYHDKYGIVEVLKFTITMSLRCIFEVETDKATFHLVGDSIEQFTSKIRPIEYWKERYPEEFI